MSALPNLHYLHLPTVVENDLLRKLEARKQRASSSAGNLNKYIDDAIGEAVKCAEFIVKEFPFSSRRSDQLSGVSPLNHFVLMQDEEVKKLAQNMVNQHLRLIRSVKLNDEEESGYGYALFQAYKLMRESMTHHHLVAPLTGMKKIKVHHLEIAIRKMLDDEWVEKRLLSLRCYYIEYCQVALGRVGKAKHQSTVISDMSFNNWTESQRKAMDFVESMCVLNEETGENFELSEVVKRTTFNPENRRVEMMVRARGFEEMAVAREYIGLFFTWTLPSKYHRNSKKWDGTSIKHGHKHAMKLWANARAVIAKDDVDYFGFRVAEPHKDGTAHGHYFLFCHPKDKAIIINAMRKYAIAEDIAELGNDITPRFDVKEADPKRGGATAYIAKYISKNINGNHLPESDAEIAAFKARAWSSIHRIRQFQQIGGATVSLWRTVRRSKPEDMDFDTDGANFHHAADKSRWADFCELAQGAELVVEKSENRFGETLRKVVGFSWLGEVITTAIGEFKLIKKSEIDGVLALRGAERLPWSTENNCNSRLIRELIKITGWTENGVQCLLNPLRIGNTVSIDKDMRLRLRDNQLLMI